MVIVLVLQILFVTLLSCLVGLFLIGLSRKMTARIHWRYGPPLSQPFIDIVKWFSQTAVSHGKLFDAGMIFSLTGSVVVVLFLPFGGICPLRGSGGLLVILYLMLIAPLGIALSAGEAANPYASIGVSRKLQLAFGYELSLLMILLSLMTYYRTVSIVDIVEAQIQSGWSLVQLPLVVSGLAYLLIMPAIMGIRPFEMIQAPQEISSGPMAEYGGKFLAFATLQHALNIYIGLSLFVNLFLGGGSNAGYFLIKLLLAFMVFQVIHAVWPRFRIEQAVRCLWRWPALLAFIGLIIVWVTTS
ncbi:MAG TPA: proton-conducting membrane transporter [Bacteroidetes bacterium]|nr:proton-conducting membrane transporter [Bacteroidota bacterium]